MQAGVVVSGWGCANQKLQSVGLLALQNGHGGSLQKQCHVPLQITKVAPLLKLMSLSLC